MIRIKNEKIAASKHINDVYGFGEAYCDYKIFSSHNIQELEKEIDEFLDDKIYIYASVACEQVSEDVQINMYHVTVYYQEWPF